MVGLKPYRIPQLGSHLPFVNQTRLITPKQQTGVYTSQLYILVNLSRLGHIQHALADLFGSSGLPAPFSTFEQYRTFTPESAVEESVGYAGSIFFFYSHIGILFSGAKIVKIIVIR